MIELRRGLDNLTRAKYTARFTTVKKGSRAMFYYGVDVKI